VTETETERWIAALERARAELETALAADPHWLALRAAEAARAEHAQALAGNLVYRCWAELDAAVAALRRETHRGASSPAQGRRRVSLRDVLEHIRTDHMLQDTMLQDTGPQAASPAEAAAASSPGPDGPATPLEAGSVEPEEATVSFVIREPARPPADARQAGEEPMPTQPAVPPAATEAPKAEPDPDPGAEAEVTIVPRRR
jgi:hypothetical protein